MSFSHLKNNKEVRMVDISNKKITNREANAVAIIEDLESKLLKKSSSDQSPKGEYLIPQS